MSQHKQLIFDDEKCVVKLESILKKHRNDEFEGKMDNIVKHLICIWKEHKCVVVATSTKDGQTILIEYIIV